jgi:hypothetical protein
MVVLQPFRELGHKAQVVQGCQAVIKPVPGFEKVVQITQAVVLAHGAIAII